MIFQNCVQDQLPLYEPAITSLTLQSYSESWLQSYGEFLKPATLKAYRESLRNHILPSLGTFPLRSIRRPAVIEFVAELKKKGLSVNSMRLVHATLRVILNNAIDDGVLAANPAQKLGKLLKRTTPGANVTPLTAEELTVFLTTIREKFPAWYALFLTLARTGLRLGEALGLQWQDINFDSRFIEVRRTVGAGRIGSPKSGKSRTVDMSRQLSGVLHEHLKNRSDEAAEKGWNEFPPWVFCNSIGTVMNADNLRGRIFYPAVQLAGLRKFRIHDLRHTFATLLIQNGESLAYIRDQLGHHSIQVTVDIYGHLARGGNRAAVDRLDDTGLEYSRAVA